MNDVATGVEEARSEIATAAVDFLPDICDIAGPTFVDGGSSGDSESIGSVATNIPIGYQSLGNGKQITIGGETYIASHKLRLPRTSQTVAITPKHIITVRARGSTGALIFQKPVISEDDSDALLVVNAVRVIQGFQ